MKLTNNNRLTHIENGRFVISNNVLPQAIQKLAEYEEMEEQQLIIKLPCKPGSSVFVIENNSSKCRDCCYYDDYEPYSACLKHCIQNPTNSYEPLCELHYWEIKQYNNVSLSYIINNLSKFGKTIFLTQTEAEKIKNKMEEM